MSRAIAMVLVLAFAGTGVLGAAAPPAKKPPAVIKQEKLTFMALKGFNVEFKDARGQPLTLWLTAGMLFKGGKPCSAKDLGVAPGKKLVVRYSKGGEYNRLLAAMDDASVPIFAELINPRNAKLVTLVKAEPGKSVTCKVGSVTKTYPLTASYFCAREGDDAEIVATKPSDPKADVFVYGDRAVAITTPDGRKLRAIVDKPTYDKFIATMTKP